MITTRHLFHLKNLNFEKLTEAEKKEILDNLKKYIQLKTKAFFFEKDVKLKETTMTGVAMAVYLIKRISEEEFKKYYDVVKNTVFLRDFEVIFEKDKTTIKWK